MLYVRNHPDVTSAVEAFHLKENYLPCWILGYISVWLNSAGSAVLKVWGIVTTKQELISLRLRFKMCGWKLDNILFQPRFVTKLL